MGRLSGFWLIELDRYGCSSERWKTLEEGQAGGEEQGELMNWAFSPVEFELCISQAAG